MRPPFLLRCAGFFNGIRWLAFMPMVGVFAIGYNRPFLWPIALLLFPLTIPFVLIWGTSQLISSFCAFCFHQHIGISATIREEGLHLKKLDSRMILWSDIQLIRRVYERYFPEYEAQFDENCAYQLTLKSGEIVYIDFIDEATFRSRVGELGIATEGFETRLAASQFEVGSVI
jgi:hypothetical protein